MMNIISLRIHIANFLQILCTFRQNTFCLHCRKHLNVIWGSKRFPHHSSLLLEAFNEKMARLNFVNVAKKKRPQLHSMTEHLLSFQHQNK